MRKTTVFPGNPRGNDLMKRYLVYKQSTGLFEFLDETETALAALASIGVPEKVKHYGVWDFPEGCVLPTFSASQLTDTLMWADANGKKVPEAAEQGATQTPAEEQKLGGTSDDDVSVLAAVARALTAVLRSSKDRSVLVAVVAALGKMDTMPSRVREGVPAAQVADLVRALRDEKAIIRWGAAKDIAKVKPRALVLVAGLLESLRDEDDGVRIEVARAIEEIEPMADPALVVGLLEAMHDPNASVRFHAVRAIEKIRPPVNQTLVAGLLEVLRNSEAFVRGSAASAIGKIQPSDPALVAGLLDAMRDLESGVRISAIWALRKIKPVADSALVTRLLEALRDDEASVRGEAALAIEEIELAADPALVAGLLKAQHDQAAGVRYCAARALGKIQPAADPAPVAGLQEAPHDPKTQLVLSRKPGEGICIGNNVRITVVEIPEDRGRVRLGIETPWDVPILRGETKDSIRDSQSRRTSQQKDEPKKVLILPSPQEFAQQLLAGLPEDKEQRIIALAGRLDEYREAVRAELERTVREYMQDHNPATLQERQRSVDFLNGLLDRLGFSLEHPGHPGQACYLVLNADSVNRNGQIRLLLKGGTARPLERSAYLSRFAELRVIDGLSPLTPTAEGQ